MTSVKTASSFRSEAVQRFDRAAAIVNAMNGISTHSAMSDVTSSGESIRFPARTTSPTDPTAPASTAIRVNRRMLAPVERRVVPMPPRTQTGYKRLRPHPTRSAFYRKTAFAIFT